MQRSILEKLKDTRLIFTVTTGRSGTAYLASVFGYAEEVCALHEPAPEFSEVLREAQGDPMLAKTFLLERKLPAIARTTSRIYVETSHLACKGFSGPLLAIGIVPDCGQKLTDYQLCFWYCLEIERRAQHYKRLFSQCGGNCVETTLTGLKSFKGLAACFAGLGLKVKKPEWLTGLRFSRSSRVKVNESRETKKPVRIPDDLDHLEEEVWQNLSGKDLGTYFPEKAGH